MTGDYQLDELAVPESLDRLHELLEQVAADHPDLAPGDLMMFETAVVEIVGNVVEHGVPPGQVRYRFRLEVLPDRLQAELVDTSDTPAPDAAGVMPAPSSEDGRGLPLARVALDELSHASPGRGNHWRMTRLRRG